MPLQVSFKPEAHCSNYPFCNETQKRPKINGINQARLDYCSKCLANSRCQEGSCNNHVPSDIQASGKAKHWSPRGRCAHHLRMDSSCGWVLCINAPNGCKQHSMKINPAKCYACSKGWLPCVNAARGCPSYVPLGRSQTPRGCIRPDNTLCPFRNAHASSQTCVSGPPPPHTNSNRLPSHMPVWDGSRFGLNTKFRSWM